MIIPYVRTCTLSQAYSYLTLFTIYCTDVHNRVSSVIIAENTYLGVN
jgi:hypothetical protein